MLPLPFAAQLFGRLLGLGTPWRLARYHWVLTEVAFTATAVVALVFVLRPRVTQAATEELQMPLAELPATGIDQVGLAVTGPVVTLLVLMFCLGLGDL